jgi:hypothetical protein
MAALLELWDVVGEGLEDPQQRRCLALLIAFRKQAGEGSTKPYGD